MANGWKASDWHAEGEAADNHLMLQCLERMVEQLTEMLATIEAGQPPGMSADTWRKIKRDARVQLVTLEWAHHCALTAYPELIT